MKQIQQHRLPSAFAGSTTVSPRLVNEKGRSYNIGQLSFSNQVLCLCSDQLLLQSDQFRALGFLGLQLGDLVHELRFVVSGWLHALLGVTDGLQDSTAVIEVMRIQVLLLAKLGEQHTNLVGDVRDRIVVRGLAPIGKLSCDGQTLLACGLVVRDQVVFGLDELVELLRQLGLDSAAEGAETEAMSRCARGAFLLVGTNGESSIPGEAKLANELPIVAEEIDSNKWTIGDLSPDFRVSLRRSILCL